MRLLALTLLLAATAVLTSPAAPKSQAYLGEIMDSTCAMQGGSHDAMMSGNPKLTLKSCTLLCVKNGAKFVLYDSGANTYQLDDQKKAQRFAGEKVVVAGTLDNATNTIQVASIKVQEIQRFAPHGW